MHFCSDTGGFSHITFPSCCLHCFSCAKVVKNGVFHAIGKIYVRKNDAAPEAGSVKATKSYMRKMVYLLFFSDSNEATKTFRLSLENLWLMPGFGGKLCNKQDGSKLVWLCKQIENMGFLPISSSITKIGHEPIYVRIVQVTHSIWISFTSKCAASLGKFI